MLRKRGSRTLDAATTYPQVVPMSRTLIMQSPMATTPTSSPDDIISEYQDFDFGLSDSYYTIESPALDYYTRDSPTPEPLFDEMYLSSDGEAINTSQTTKTASPDPTSWLQLWESASTRSVSPPQQDLPPSMPEIGHFHFGQLPGIGITCDNENESLDTKVFTASTIVYAKKGKPAVINVRSPHSNKSAPRTPTEPVSPSKISRNSSISTTRDSVWSHPYSPSMPDSPTKASTAASSISEYHNIDPKFQVSPATRQDVFTSPMYPIVDPKPFARKQSHLRPQLASQRSSLDRIEERPVSQQSSLSRTKATKLVKGQKNPKEATCVDTVEVDDSRPSTPSVPLRRRKMSVAGFSFRR